MSEITSIASTENTETEQRAALFTTWFGNRDPNVTLESIEAETNKVTYPKITDFNNVFENAVGDLVKTNTINVLETWGEERYQNIINGQNNMTAMLNDIVALTTSAAKKVFEEDADAVKFTANPIIIGKTRIVAKLVRSGKNSEPEMLLSVKTNYEDVITEAKRYVNEIFKKD